MSRKDSRRAIAIAMPPAMLACLRARQARSRGRRLMDTLRTVLADALAAPVPRLASAPPAPPKAPVRLLQLPCDLRQRLDALCRDTGLTPQAAIAALVLGLETAPDPAATAGAAPWHTPGHGLRAARACP